MAEAGPRASGVRPAPRLFPDSGVPVPEARFQARAGGVAAWLVGPEGGSWCDQSQCVCGWVCTCTRSLEGYMNIGRLQGRELGGVGGTHGNGMQIYKKIILGTSLVAQWLGLHAPKVGVPVPSLVRELGPTCHN